MPDIKLPPKKEKQKGQPSANKVYNAYINRHPILRPYAQAIAKAAKDNGFDALFFAILIFAAESGGNPRADSGQAAGLTQISYRNIRAAGKTIEWVKNNPLWAIQWSARKIGKAYRKYGNYHDVYVKDYNPDDANREKAWARMEAQRPKNYTYGTGGNVSLPSEPKVPPKTPREQVLEDIQRGRIKEQITQEGFLREWDKYNNIYTAYQGRKATRSEAQWLYKHGIGEFSLAKALATDKRPKIRKAFMRSPIWESKAPEYEEVAKSIFGDQIPPGLNWKDLTAKAIANNWSDTTFAAKLREHPSYFKSNEFKKGEASLGNIYRAMYGEPDNLGKVAIREATLGRWTEDQWAGYLRSLPEYRNSREYQAKRAELAEKLGYLPVEKQLPSDTSRVPEAIPNSPRIPGQAAGAPPDVVPPVPTKPKPKPKPKPKKQKPKPKGPQPEPPRY